MSARPCQNDPDRRPQEPQSIPGTQDASPLQGSPGTQEPSGSRPSAPSRRGAPLAPCGFPRHTKIHHRTIAEWVALGRSYACDLTGRLTHEVSGWCPSCRGVSDDEVVTLTCPDHPGVRYDVAMSVAMRSPVGRCPHCLNVGGCPHQPHNWRPRHSIFVAALRGDPDAAAVRDRLDHPDAQARNQACSACVSAASTLPKRFGGRIALHCPDHGLHEVAGLQGAKSSPTRACPKCARPCDCPTAGRPPLRSESLHARAERNRAAQEGCLDADARFDATADTHRGRCARCTGTRTAKTFTFQCPTCAGRGIEGLTGRYDATFAAVLDDPDGGCPVCTKLRTLRDDPAVPAAILDEALLAEAFAAGAGLGDPLPFRSVGCALCAHDPDRDDGSPTTDEHGDGDAEEHSERLRQGRVFSVTPANLRRRQSSCWCAGHGGDITQRYPALVFADRRAARAVRPCSADRADVVCPTCGETRAAKAATLHDLSRGHCERCLSRHSPHEALLTAYLEAALPGTRVEWCYRKPRMGDVEGWTGDRRIHAGDVLVLHGTARAMLFYDGHPSHYTPAGVAKDIRRLRDLTAQGQPDWQFFRIRSGDDTTDPFPPDVPTPLRVRDVTLAAVVDCVAAVADHLGLEAVVPEPAVIVARYEELLAHCETLDPVARARARLAALGLTPEAVAARLHAGDTYAVLAAGTGTSISNEALGQLARAAGVVAQPHRGAANDVEAARAWFATRGVDGGSLDRVAVLVEAHGLACRDVARLLDEILGVRIPLHGLQEWLPRAGVTLRRWKPSASERATMDAVVDSELRRWKASRPGRARRTGRPAGRARP